MGIEQKSQDVLASLGGRIRKVRNACGMTQETLAARAEVSISTLSKIETGTSVPTLDVFFRLTLVLEQSLDGLVGWKEPKLSGDARKRAALVDQVRSALAPLPIEQLEALAELLRR